MSMSVLELFLLAQSTPRQGALVTIWALWAEIVTFPPQTAVAKLLFPPVTVAVLWLLAQTLLLLPLVTEAVLPVSAVTLLLFPLVTEAVLSSIALTWLKLLDPVTVAVLPKPAMAMFPKVPGVVVAVAVLSLNATARFPVDASAVLAPPSSSGIPPTEIDTSADATPASGTDIAPAATAPTSSFVSIFIAPFLPSPLLQWLITFGTALRPF
jgi:hypothetical protein